MENRHNSHAPPTGSPSVTEEQDISGASPEPISTNQPNSPPLSFASSLTAVATTESHEVSQTQTGAQNPPSRSSSWLTSRLSFATSFSKFVSRAKPIIDKAFLGIRGVAFEQKQVGEDKAWVITITKAGRWLVYLHIFLSVVSIFDLATTIYSWKSNADSDAMMQKILTKMSESGSQFEGFSNEFTKWMNTTKIRAAQEEARLTEEQNRWNALLKVFEDCGTAQNRPNGTERCSDLRRFFENNPLPHPDKSPIAKRNVAKLDRIIRRVHLGGPPPLNPNPGQGSHLQPSIGGYSGIFLASISITWLLILYYLLWPGLKHRIFQSLKRHKTKIRRADDHADEKVDNDVDDSGSMAITLTGGDYFGPPNNLTFRNLQRFNQHVAAAQGSVTTLRDNEVSIRVNEIDKDNEYGPVLAAAARSGSLETIDYILSRKPDLNKCGGRYQSALQAAAHSGNRSVVHRLLTAGARDTSTGGFYGTAANAAAEKGGVEMLQDLLAHYTDREHIVNYPGGTYGHALIAAGVRGDNRVIKILLDNGALVSNANQDGTTALHQAAGNGHIETVEVLLARGAEVNLLSSVYGTPLHAACRGLHAGVAKRLLAANVDVSIKSDRQRTILHDAAQTKEGLEDVFREILRLRPDMIDEVDADGVTALHLASISGNATVVKSLLDAGANCSIGDKFQAQPLFRAAGCGHAEIVELLLKYGKADPDASDCFGRTALHGPARTDDVRVHEHLIKANANVNAVGTDRKTPLHEACNMGRIKNVELLLAHPDIKVNELDNDQFPPLYKALCSSDGNKDNYNSCINRDVIESFLNRADVNVNVSNGIIVQEAARKGYLHEVERMLEKSQSSLQMRGGKYGGVLQAASISGNLQLINLLLKPEYHADTDIQGGEFGCPLAAAAAFGHVDVVRRLLEAGANPSVSGVGRYESPMQSTCRKVEEYRKARDRYRWASIEDQIRNLFSAYGVVDTKPAATERFLDWRWLVTTTGWDWVPPGEL